MVSEGEDDSWLTKIVARLVRRYIDVSDARQVERLHSGRNLDEHGLPVGAIPQAYVEARSEARLIFPGAHEVFKKVDRGPGSMVRMVLSFDSPPEARVLAGYVAQATPTEVLEWYGDELAPGGWEKRRLSRSAKERWIAIEVFHRGRESLSVTFPGSEIANPALNRRRGRPLLPHETYYLVDYRITVEQVFRKPSAP